jgi:hypothetical protein
MDSIPAPGGRQANSRDRGVSFKYIASRISLQPGGTTVQDSVLSQNWRPLVVVGSFRGLRLTGLLSDLNGSKPFARTIRDPFEQLLAEISLNKSVERKVQLAVNLFREAEHLDLTVRE